MVTRLAPRLGVVSRLGGGSLPRFTATSRAWPGLTVGSTLDGGPNWADDAIGFLVACEVDRGAIVALMSGPQPPPVRSQVQCSAQPMS